MFCLFGVFFAVYTHLQSPPSSCKEKKNHLWSQGNTQTWSSRDSTSIKLQEPGQCCTHSSAVGILPLLRELSRGNHTLTPISKPRMQGSHQPLLAMLHPQKGFWTTDVLSHCLFLCPALTRSWFCPNMFFFFFRTKEGLFPPLQDPFSSPKHRLGNKDCWEAAWSGTEERARLNWDVCTFGVKRLYSKCMLLIQRCPEPGPPSPAPAGELSSLCHPKPCPSPTTHQVARD